MQKLLSFLFVCVHLSLRIDGCNGLADDVFPSPVSSGPHGLYENQLTTLKKSWPKSMISRAFWSISLIYCGADNIYRPLNRYEAFSFTFYGFIGDSKCDRNQFHPLSFFLLFVTTSDSPQYTVLWYSL